MSFSYLPKAESFNFSNRQFKREITILLSFLFEMKFFRYFVHT